MVDLQISDHSSSLNDRPAKRHLPRPLFAQPNDLMMPIVELLPNHQLEASDSVVLDATSLGPYEFYSARSTFWKLFTMNCSKKGLEKINNPEHFSSTSTSKTKNRKESTTNKFHQEKPHIHRSLLAQPPTLLICSSLRTAQSNNIPIREGQVAGGQRAAS